MTKPESAANKKARSASTPDLMQCCSLVFLVIILPYLL